MADSYDVFLVLHPFRDKLRQNLVFVSPLAPLDLLLGVEVFYHPGMDVALVGLRCDPDQVAERGAPAVHAQASQCGVPMVVPAQLTAEERRRFFLEQVSEYSVYLQQYASADDPQPLIARALAALHSHIEVLPAPRRAAAVDIAATLPLFDGDCPPVKRRLDSVG